VGSIWRKFAPLDAVPRVATAASMGAVLQAGKAVLTPRNLICKANMEVGKTTIRESLHLLHVATHYGANGCDVSI